jgi:IclR family mhp operon transcriptional activator
MLETLCSAGDAYYDPDNKTYSLAVRSLALANNFSPDQFFLRIAAPIMKKLRSRLGWPSDLAICDHDKMVIMDTNREPGAFSINRSRGSRVSMMPTALGRAYLAFCPEPERQVILERLQASNDEFESAARDPSRVANIIEETRNRGYAISNREYLKTTRAAAVPILNGASVICCINVVIVPNAVSLEELQSKYAPILFDAKKELEERLHMSR